MFDIESLVGSLPGGVTLTLPLSAYLVGAVHLDERAKDVARSRVGSLIVCGTRVEAQFFGLNTTWEPMWRAVAGIGRRPFGSEAKAVFDVVRYGKRIELGWTPVDGPMLAATPYAQRDSRGAHKLLSPDRRPVAAVAAVPDVKSPVAIRRAK